MYSQMIILLDAFVGHILHVPFLRIHHHYITYCCCSSQLPLMHMKKVFVTFSREKQGTNTFPGPSPNPNPNPNCNTEPQSFRNEALLTIAVHYTAFNAPTNITI